MAYAKKTKKQKQNVESALVHVKSTFNNTLVTVTSTTGDVLLRCSAGRLGYKGARKGTPYAATQIGTTLAKDMQVLGVKTVEVRMRGIGNGRDSVARSLQAAGLNVIALKDVTPIAHAGCRAPKRRRV